MRRAGPWGNGWSGDSLARETDSAATDDGSDRADRVTFGIVGIDEHLRAPLLPRFGPLVGRQGALLVFFATIGLVPLERAIVRLCSLTVT
jgi:hypothetical protein